MNARLLTHANCDSLFNILQEQQCIQCQSYVYISNIIYSLYKMFLKCIIQYTIKLGKIM